MNCGSVIVVENIIITKQSKKIIICREFLEKKNFFGSPFIESSSLHIYLVSKLSGLTEKPVSDIAAKMILLPFQNKQVAFPLIHCLN